MQNFNKAPIRNTKVEFGDRERSRPVIFNIVYSYPYPNNLMTTAFIINKILKNYKVF